MTVALVYKTSSPKAIEWFRDLNALFLINKKLREAYAKNMFDEFGPVGLRFEYDSEPVEDRPLMRNSENEITGVMSASGEAPPKGSGWRLDAESGFWKPDLRSKAGKERAAELEKLKGPTLTSADGASVGITPVAFAFEEHRLYRPGVSFREGTGELYVSWGSAACEPEARKTIERAASDVSWERVPLSEWHAWQEQIEQASKAN